MNSFPDFMKREANKIPSEQQNTPDIEGYYYTAPDGSQMAFWTCMADRVSKEHIHDYDEYMICVEGEYTVTINGEATVLHAGDELFIPKGSLQGGGCKAGTRTIHAFGGKRVKLGKDIMDIKNYSPDMRERVHDFFGRVFPESGKSFESEGRHSVFADIERNFIVFLCLFDGDKIIGTAAVKRLNASDCELKGLYLYKEYHGRGLGFKLADTAVEAARRLGFERIFLDTMSGYDRAMRLYEKMGFVRTDRYNDNERADVFMVKSLNDGVIVREITDNDFDGLMCLYTELHDNPLPERSEHVMAVWERILSDKDHHIIVAEVDGAIAASCVCVIIPNLTRGQRPYAFVENVVTSAAFRRRGLATACLNYARELAGNENCYKIMLLTGSKEQGVLSFYESAGYNSSDKTAFIQWL